MTTDPVSTTTTIKATAADEKTGMTVGELQAFTAATARAELPLDTRLKIRAGYQGQIRWIEVAG